MSKADMASHIKSTYKGLEQKILLSQLNNLKSGKAYGFVHAGTKMELTNNNGDYKLQNA